MTFETRKPSDVSPNLKTSCATCSYADKHGWWGPEHRGTHCRTCCRSWVGRAEAHCSTCCQHFSSDGPAQRHRLPHGACQAPAGVLRKDGTAVFKAVERASGLVWVGTGMDGRWTA